MKFADVMEKRDAAKAAKVEIDGDDNFPGLSRYDRIYSIPDDRDGWPCSVIVRASAQYVVGPGTARTSLEIHSFRVPGYNYKPIEWHELTWRQLEAVATIARQVENWVLGAVDHMPPSTDRHWNRDNEL